MSALTTPIDPTADGARELPATVVKRRRGALRRLPGKTKVGAAILALFILVAIIGPTIAPFDPSATTPGQALPLAPNATHLLGTTATGQDVLSQLLVGTRSTVVLGLLTGLIATILSIVIGMSAGFLGGMSDEGLSLLANVFLVLPALPLLVVILGYLPHSGELPTAIVLSALGWPWGARVIRAQTLSLRNRDYVAAARESGDGAGGSFCSKFFPTRWG
jgi:peptide/nickel transport system permease protein